MGIPIQKIYNTNHGRFQTQLRTSRDEVEIYLDRIYIQEILTAVGSRAVVNYGIDF